MAASTSKRVLAVRFDREPLAGFVDTASFLRAGGVELLSPEGIISVLPYQDVKALCFVRDFESFPGWRENRLFASRPKMEGLWVRFHFRDDDQMDGVVSNNVLSWDAAGFTAAPPDPTFHNQRMFIPRAALLEAKVLGVVGPQVRQQRHRKPAVPTAQLEMFDK